MVATPRLLLAFGATQLNAAVPRDFAVDLKATVSDTSPCITLSWTQSLAQVRPDAVRQVELDLRITALLARLLQLWTSPGTETTHEVSWVKIGMVLPVWRDNCQRPDKSIEVIND
jgi:hypothetical protein